MILNKNRVKTLNNIHYYVSYTKQFVIRTVPTCHGTVLSKWVAKTSGVHVFWSAQFFFVKVARSLKKDSSKKIEPSHLAYKPCDRRGHPKAMSLGSRLKTLLDGNGKKKSKDCRKSLIVHRHFFRLLQYGWSLCFIVA